MFLYMNAITYVLHYLYMYIYIYIYICIYYIINTHTLQTCLSMCVDEYTFTCMFIFEYI